MELNYKVINHEMAEVKLAELTADTYLIQSVDDGLQLLGDMYYSGFDAIILHSKNIVPDFFDLKNKMAGEILQKFSNYRMRLFIVGDFSSVSSKSLSDFIRESNKGKQVNFVGSLDEILA